MHCSELDLQQRESRPGLRAQGLEIGGLGFRVWGLGYCIILGFGHGVWDLGIGFGV